MTKKTTNKKKSKIQSDLEENNITTDLKITKTTFKSDSQKDFFVSSLQDELKVLICNGPAGSSKTFLAVYAALNLLKKQKIEKIIYVRAAVESADSRMGYLPGDMNEKFFAYTTPLEEKLSEFVDSYTYKKLKDGKYIESLPINFLRGVSWKNSCIILDEAQNMTQNELKTFMTRIGENCKTFILGDSQQSDIGKRSFFDNVINMFSNDDAELNGIFIKLLDEDEIHRSELCKFIVNTFKKYK